MVDTIIMLILETREVKDSEDRQLARGSRVSYPGLEAKPHRSRTRSLNQMGSVPPSMRYRATVPGNPG